VGGRRAQVVCTRRRGSFGVAVEGGGRFSVSEDGSRIASEGRSSAQLDDPLVRQTLLGPCLGLALAAQGVYCLHAAAVRSGRAAFALIGESGTGKSTLACALDGGSRWKRVADDLLPVALRDGEALALPRYPQLKLSHGEQWRGEDALPLVAGFLLRPAVAAAEVEVTPLSPRQGLLGLLRHTVVARLFDGPLRRHHLEFATRLSGAVDLFRIEVPRSMERLPEVCRRIEHQLS
jgi:hypothetical protein